MKYMIFRVSTALLLGALTLTATIASAAEDVYNVRNYGAVGDGTNLDSPAIDKAIDDAADAGGGTVLVPAGTYLIPFTSRATSICSSMPVPPSWPRPRA
jgi:hypothetical protein